MDQTGKVTYNMKWLY